jgi:hypothetical protein
MEEILRMIEGVDPSDEAALNLIDAHVYVFLNLHKGFRVSYSKGTNISITYRHESWKPEDHSVLKHMFDYYQYTRSRDTLKSIRPNQGASYFQVKNGDNWDNWFCTIRWWSSANKAAGFNSPYLPTEELAELHAIIQAINHERKESDNERE